MLKWSKPDLCAYTKWSDSVFSREGYSFVLGRRWLDRRGRRTSTSDEPRPRCSASSNALRRHRAEVDLRRSVAIGTGTVRPSRSRWKWLHARSASLLAPRRPTARCPWTRRSTRRWRLRQLRRPPSPSVPGEPGHDAQAHRFSRSSYWASRRLYVAQRMRGGLGGNIGELSRVQRITVR